jgi:hypothetical protein
MVGSTFALAMFLIAGDHTAINPLFQSLQNPGFALDGTARVTLPAPLVADGLDATAQQAALAKIVGDRYPVEEFTRPSVVAPFVLKLPKASGATAAGRGVDLWFIVHGDLDDLAKDDILKEFTTARGKDATIHVLTPAELKDRQIPSASSGEKRMLAPGETEERYAHTVATILDRVELHSTSRCVLSRTEDSVVIATLVDHRFDNDREFPNSYRRLIRSESGETSKGPPQPYSGAGGYLKATQLSDPKGAILVEYHSIYSEPNDWFNGANLLQSKLPILLQSRVRELRRDLRK